MVGSLIIFVFGFFLIILGAGVGIRHNTNPLPIIFIAVGIIICVCAIVPSISNDKPTAMDVYRGRTTLQITYRDSIPVDSVVVYRN